ncbi:MAG: S41 family peptidase [Bacteroidota bacterium]
MKRGQRKTGAPVLRGKCWFILTVAFLSQSSLKATSGDLSTAERIVGLTKLYMEVKYNFANWDNVPELDWDKTFTEYLSKVEKEQTDEEYYLTLKKFISLLHDGHTDVFYPKQILGGLEIPPVIIRPIEGKAIILNFAATDECRKAGLTNGLEVTKVEGRPISEILEKDLFPSVAASTVQGRNLESYRLLMLGRKGTKVSFEVRDREGTIRVLSLTRNLSDTPRELRPPEWNPPLLVHKVIEEGIHYFALNSFANEKIVDDFDAAFDSLRDIKGLIFDVRRNSGGSDGNGFQIIGRIIDKPLRTSILQTIQYNPRFRARGNEIDRFWLTITNNEIKPRGLKPYVGPVVVLTSAFTASAAEDFLIPLDYGRRATTVGERTAGTTGLPLYIDLPGGGRARICTTRDTYPDGRKWVGVGIIPHIEVYPRREDVLQGRDAVFEKGLEVLRQKIKGD